STPSVPRPLEPRQRNRDQTVSAEDRTQQELSRLSKTYRDRQQLDEETPRGREIELVEGLIVDGSRGIYRVEAPDGPVVCTIRGRLRKVLEYADSASARRAARRVAVKPHDPVAVGDRVRVLLTSGGTQRRGVIEEILVRGGGAFTRRDPDPKQ